MRAQAGVQVLRPKVVLDVVEAEHFLRRLHRLRFQHSLADRLRLAELLLLAACPACQGAVRVGGVWRRFERERKRSAK